MGALLRNLVIRAALILIGIAAVSEIVLIGASDSNTLSNPFLMYADILPGQIWEDAKHPDFVCSTPNPPNQHNKMCLLEPESELFAEIQVVISYSTRRINSTVFIPVANRLRCGEFMLYWQKLGTKIESGVISFRQLDYHIVAILAARKRHFTYLDSIIYVSFGAVTEPIYRT